MATGFEDLVNNMVNIGFGVAATAAEKGKSVLDDLSAKGAEVRSDPSQPDFARSMADVFERAGGTFSDMTDRWNAAGSTVAERILDELIVARLRPMTTSERARFTAHVQELADSLETVTVEVEADEADDAPAQADPADGADAQQDA